MLNRTTFEEAVAARLGDGCDSASAMLVIRLSGLLAAKVPLSSQVEDQVLELVCLRLQSALREEDCIAHLAGDRYAIFLQSTSSAQGAGIVATRLMDLVLRPYIVQGEVVNVGASIGIACVPAHGVEVSTLLNRADIASRCAIVVGSGTASIFENDMEDRIVSRRELAVHLRKALLLKQLEVHYQPQVNLAIQNLTGFEALLRWTHPVLGSVSPGEFIPVAEEIGMIGTIGEWVLRTACRQALLLPEQMIVAVNVSPSQFKTGTLLQSVENALTLAGIPPSRLELEITEGVLMQNTDAVFSTLDDLRSLGVRLALDDFGTGYSSLSQLAQLPIDTLKIDRSFVGSTAKQRAIVQSIATLGNGLGMSTLVEGIETEEQLTNSYLDGCKSAQGYLFGKAVPASALGELLTRFAERYEINH